MMYSPLLALLLFSIPVTVYSAQPIYEYLRNLCPSDLIPVTGVKSVRTCDEGCPSSSRCINGICCSPPPSCDDPDHSYATTFACLPSSKNGCPRGTKCLPSSNEGQFICCARTIQSPAKKKNVSSDKKGSSRVEVCPPSHPIALSHPSKGLLQCKDCEQGICVQFRRSSVLICCQSHSAVCGESSQVEVRGGVAVDCSIDGCSSGFECTSTPSDARVCCSNAVCKSGERSSRSCAGGCLEGERCEEIKGERWCCPSSEEEEKEEEPVCPDGSVPSYPCTLLSGSASECRGEREERCLRTSSTTAHCCPRNKREATPTCRDGSTPLSTNQEALSCPEIGAPCPKIGYSCQSPLEGKALYCCRDSLASLFITAPSTSPSPSPSTPFSPPQEGSCPFSYDPVASVLTGKRRTCTGFLDFTCPFGYSCMPSASTPSFLCCIKRLF